MSCHNEEEGKTFIFNLPDSWALDMLHKEYEPEGSLRYDDNGTLYKKIDGEWRGEVGTQTECSHADARVVYSACGVDLVACECGYEGKR